jgi:hypothetical protein
LFDKPNVGIGCAFFRSLWDTKKHTTKIHHHVVGSAN